MKVNFYTSVSSNRKLNWWTFVLIPTIAIQRNDKFADEAAYYVGVFWLVFQIYIVIRKKK